MSHPVIHAFLATCFIWGVTALGSSSVSTFKEVSGRVLDGILGFVAEAMIFVVVVELIPECQRGWNASLATAGVMIGFALMMVLDVDVGQRSLRFEKKSNRRIVYPFSA